MEKNTSDREKALLPPEANLGQRVAGHHAFDAKYSVRELDPVSLGLDIYVNRPRELDHLQLSQAGFLAQRRLARGLQLNEPEVSHGCWSSTSPSQGGRANSGAMLGIYS